MVLQAQKRMMALAGMVLTAYLVFHMMTNLSFFSEATFNAFYAGYNRGFIRWPLLILILFSIAIHIVVAVKIRRVNAKARGIDYAKYDKFKIPALFVTISVFFLLLFMVIHILQALTFDTRHLYGEWMGLFQSGYWVLFYVAGLFVLMMHLQHALANVLQTLGKTAVIYRGTVWIVTLALTGGFASIPLSVYFAMT